MSESITPKQRKFIEGIANGLTHAESYRIAYSNSGKPATARREASRLMKNPIIRTALESLIRRKENANIARHVSSQDLVSKVWSRSCVNQVLKGVWRGTLTNLVSHHEKLSDGKILGSKRGISIMKVLRPVLGFGSIQICKIWQGREFNVFDSMLSDPKSEQAFSKCPQTLNLFLALSTYPIETVI